MGSCPSTGNTKRMNSGDSWLSRTVLSLGFAELSKNNGLRGAGCAWRMVRPEVGSPPWQSVQPSRTNSLPCGSCAFSWHSMQPLLLAIIVATDWSTLLGLGIATSGLGVSRTAMGGPKRPAGAGRSWERAGMAAAQAASANEIRKCFSNPVIVRRSCLLRGIRCKGHPAHPGRWTT